MILKQDTFNLVVQTVSSSEISSASLSNPFRESGTKFDKGATSCIPWCKRFFLVGGDKIERQSRDGKSRSGENVSRRSALLTLTFLAAGEREDLWHPGYDLHVCLFSK